MKTNVFSVCLLGLLSFITIYKRAILVHFFTFNLFKIRSVRFVTSFNTVAYYALLLTSEFHYDDLLFPCSARFLFFFTSGLDLQVTDKM